MGIVRGDNITYIYDVGSTPETLEFLHSLNGRCDIVISHFHGDHTWWLTKHHRGEDGVEPDDTISLTYERPAFRRLYVGALTKKYISDGTVVTEPTMISSSSGTVFRANERGFDPGSESSYDGVKIDVYALPNSHCKGARCRILIAKVRCL